MPARQKSRLKYRYEVVPLRAPLYLFSDCRPCDNRLPRYDAHIDHSSFCFYNFFLGDQLLGYGGKRRQPNDLLKIQRDADRKLHNLGFRS